MIRGCVPKKLMVYGSAVRHQLSDAASYGWSVSGSATTAACCSARCAEVDRLNQLHIGFLEKAGWSWCGLGRLADDRTVSVQDSTGSETRREAECILIAVGGRPHRPEIPGAELGWVKSDLFELPQFPNEVVVVGAGFIACEFACILNGLGVKVTQLVRGDHLLRGFDRECGLTVQEAMEAEGITVRLAHSPAAIEGEPGALTVVTQSGERIACNGVLLATGRRPFLAGLNSPLASRWKATAFQSMPISAPTCPTSTP